MRPGWGRGACCLLLCVGALVGWSRRSDAQEDGTPAGRGSVVGSVVDAVNARPISGATVQLEGGARGQTDVNGFYRIYAVPGAWRVRVSASRFATAVLENVLVRENQSTRADASLAPAPRGAGKAGVEVVEVTADVTESTEATQLLKRRMAPTVADSLGADAIAKTPDSDAAEVVTRVPAVTIKDDKFIIVRGLGERYSSALLNGSRLPSTDPNRRIVPLDIFPADFIESLNVIKTFTPDLPGDFSGGLVDIKIAEPPLHLTYGVSTSLGFNTETTFQDYDTYDGFPADWFGLGDDPRALPSTFDIFPQQPGVAFSPTTTQMRALVGSLPDNWNITRSTAPPDFGIDAFVGDTWGPFGLNFAAAYQWKFRVHRDEVANAFGSVQEIEQDTGEQFTYDESTFETQLGAVLSSQYTFSQDHKLLARGLVNRQGTDFVQQGTGEDADSLPNQPQIATTTQYTVNQLGLGALEGLHHFSVADLDWRASWAPSAQIIPDSKFYVYWQDPPVLGVDNPPSAILQPQRTWSNLNEFLQDYYVDATVPFRTRLPFTDAWRGLGAQFKTGLNYMLRDRNLLYQDYRISGIGASVLDLELPPDSLMIPPNFSTDGPLTFNRLSYQPFEASQEVAAGYGMLDLPIIEDRLRLIAGARLEYSYITTEGFAAVLGNTGSRINDLDPEPGVNLVYTPRDDMNVRAAFSQTVSRPEFRELTPIFFTTLPGNRTLIGNQYLITANITNWDLRWEWFLSPLELLSASFFYKELENPIELVTAGDAGGQLYDTYVNFESASLYGFELETRKDFNFAVPYLREVSWLRSVAPYLADLQLLVNVSVIESSASEDFLKPSVCRDVSSSVPVCEISPAPGEQRLQGQSPFVINAALEYEHYQWGIFRLLYNTVGPTIVARGTQFGPSQPLPNIEAQRRDQLDFVWLADVTLFDTPFSTKFAVENILNDQFLETQGSRVTNRYVTGLSFSTGLSYSF